MIIVVGNEIYLDGHKVASIDPNARRAARERFKRMIDGAGKTESISLRPTQMSRAIEIGLFPGKWSK
jgi:hypothetical protein